MPAKTAGETAAPLAGRGPAPSGAPLAAVSAEARAAGDHAVWLLADALTDAAADSRVLAGVPGAVLAVSAVGRLSSPWHRVPASLDPGDPAFRRAVRLALAEGFTLPIQATPSAANAASTDAHSLKRSLIRPCSTITSRRLDAIGGTSSPAGEARSRRRGTVRGMDLHPGETIVFEGHPSWRALLSFYIGGLAGAIAIAVIVWLISGIALAVLVGAVLGAAVIVFGLVKRTATDYMVSNQRLYIRRGILSKKVQQTRIDRVQNVNTDQSFRERLLRVGTVDFDTAGTDDSEFRFVGINNPAEVANAVDRAQREAAV